MSKVRKLFTEYTTVLEIPLMLHPRRFLLLVILRSKGLHLFNSKKKNKRKYTEGNMAKVMS